MKEATARIKIKKLWRPPAGDSFRMARRQPIFSSNRASRSRLVQLDDLDSAALHRLHSVAFLTLATSPGNHQAWIAVDHIRDATKMVDMGRRLRKGTGADLSASGATRLAGTLNYKRKYESTFLTVSIDSVACGRIVTPEQLQQLGLLASPEPIRTPPCPRRVSETQNTRRWPSYEISLMRARKRKDGLPDRSDADFKWCLTALTGGKSVEDTKAKLLEVSERAQERRDRDPGYVHITVENAARCVEQNYGKGQGRT